MRPKTVQRLIILFVVAVVASVSTFMTQRYQLSRMDRSLRARALQATSEGDYLGAVRLWEEHLQIEPDDQDAMVQLAEMLLKAKKDVGRQDQAIGLFEKVIGLFEKVLVRSPERNDIRRRLAEQLIESGLFERSSFTPRELLEALLKLDESDGHLQFLLAKCLEHEGAFARAVKSYQSAIEHGAPETLEAYRQAAELLQTQLKKPDDAAQLINAMVQSDPNNYRVYLERGRFQLQFAKTPAERQASKLDFERARKEQPGEPEVYLDLAQISVTLSNFDDARKLLEEGLQAVPKQSAVQLHQAMAVLENRTGSPTKAIARLHQSIKELPDEAILHWDLAQLLADRGDTSELLVEIEELKRLNFPVFLRDFLEARRQINNGEWKQARETLNRLQSQYEFTAPMKVRVNTLLALCYEHLGEMERSRDALDRALGADPSNLQARFGMAQALVARGELDKAIEEYRKLVSVAPRALTPLAQLLIARNQRRLQGNRDWSEIEALIKKAKELAPRSGEWVLLQADLFLGQGKAEEAERLLETARAGEPQQPELWLKSAEVAMLRRKFSEARALLNQVPGAVNPVDLRLAKARLLIAEGDPNLARDLAALSSDSSSFSISERRRLLESLARALIQLKDYAKAKDLWLEVGKLAPNDIGPQLSLIDLAFETKNEDEIKHQIAKIKEIEGGDESIGRSCEIQYAIWQARNATDQDQRQTLCNTARQMVDDLKTRRPAWRQVFFALAQIDEVELDHSDIAAPARKEKQYEAAGYYLRAIELGLRSLAITRRATELLFASDHPQEIAQLWNQLGAGGTAGLDLQGQVTEEVLRKGDSDLALDLARKAKAADPKDLLKRIQLVHILVASGHRDDAELELREAVKVAPGEFERWLLLVGFLIQGKQFQKAEEAIRDAEQTLKTQSPLGLAQCSELLGSAYKASDRDPDKSKQWYQVAEQWYRNSLTARPGASSINRPLVEFLIRTGRGKEAAAQLETILDSKNPGEVKNAEELSWARRTLARLWVLSEGGYQQVVKALALVEPIARAAETVGQSEGTRIPADDLRVLAEVYEAQRTSASHKRAREILETLVARSADTPQDRFTLATIYSKDGDWSKARVHFQTLLAQIENSRDPAVVSRRPDYLARYILELLKSHQAGKDQQALNDARDLIDQLSRLRPDPLIMLELEARLHKALGQVDQAVALIRSMADQAGASENMLWGLARLAEKLERLDLAEELLRRLVSRSDQAVHRVKLIEFLGRAGKAKDAVDLCEGLWRKADNPSGLVPTALITVLSPAGKRDQAQLNRVAAWFDDALKRYPKSPKLLLGLGQLREQQVRYQEAEDLYRQGVGLGEGNSIALNNLAWLMALRKEKPTDALGFINRAITQEGPLADLLDTRGGVYLAAGESLRAIEDFNEAVAQDPTGPKYFHLAQAYLQASKKEQAHQALGQARTKGLAEDLLHPLEVTAYQKVLAELGIR
jgi:tetratricopeptide (TPR) repeat protein